MSVVADLAARLRASTDQLPGNTVISAADHLTVASELLAWVRRTSSHPIGVPHLAGAIEHLEHASRALMAANESVESYLASIGVASIGTRDVTGEITRRPAQDDEPAGDTRPAPVMPLERWWVDRVDKLTIPEGEPRPAAPTRVTSTDGGQRPSGGHGRQTSGQGDAVDLLQTVAKTIRDDDRSSMRARLREADPPVGLGLSAISPVALRRLATEYLGHPPGPDDLRALRDVTESRLRVLLPGASPAVSTTLLSRLCAIPKDQRDHDKDRERERDERRDRDASGSRRDIDEGVPHPADSAVAGAVLVGLLLQRLGKHPDAIAEDLTSAESRDG